MKTFLNSFSNFVFCLKFHQTEVGEHYLLIFCPAHKIELVIKDAFEQSDFNNNCSKDYINVYYLF